MKHLFNTLVLSSLLATFTLAAEPVTTTSTPDEELAKMQQYIHSMFSNVSVPAFSNYNYPRTNIQDLSDKLLIDFDLAGVEKKDINLSIDNHKILRLSGKKEEKIEQQNKDGSYVRKEIYYGSFQKAIQLPETAKVEKLETKYENGILHITIPKEEPKQPKVKNIPIN